MFGFWSKVDSYWRRGDVYVENKYESSTKEKDFRLVLDDDDHRANTKPKYQEPKLAAYDVDWFD